jgi:hypothetical protein
LAFSARSEATAFFAARVALAGCGRFGVAALLLAGFAFAEGGRFGVAALLLAGFALAEGGRFGVAALLLLGFAFAGAGRFGVAALLLAGFAFATVGCFGAAALVVWGFAAAARAGRFGWAGSGRGSMPSGAARSGTGSGTRVPPAASSATSSAIFFARPEAVLTPLVRAASSRMFGWLRRLKVSSARGSASIATRRSAGIMVVEASRLGAAAASRRPFASDVVPVDLAPGGHRTARHVALKERRLIQALADPIDPAPAQRDVGGLHGRDRRHAAARLVDPDPYFLFSGVMSREPLFECRLARKRLDSVLLDDVWGHALHLGGKYGKVNRTRAFAVA